MTKVWPGSSTPDYDNFNVISTIQPQIKGLEDMLADTKLEQDKSNENLLVSNTHNLARCLHFMLSKDFELKQSMVENYQD